MPRWLQIVLTLALYAALMGAAWWVLKSTIPIALEAGYRWIGQDGVTVVMAAIWITGALYLWRDSARRRRAGFPDR